MRLADPARSRAVLVGTAKPGLPDVADLPAVTHSLTGLADTISDVRSATLPASNVTRLLDPLRPHSTGVAIANAVDEAEDLAFVYVAGHLWLDRPSQPHLALAREDRNARSSTLELMWVANSLAECTARVKLLMLDVQLAGVGAEDPAAATNLARLCGVDGRTTTWVFAGGDARAYNQPGSAATNFTGALLELVHALRYEYTGFTLSDLHVAASGWLQAQSLPEPVLLDARVASAADIALVQKSTAAPVSSDLDAVRQLISAAAAADRDYHRPELAADAYRSLLLAATRVLGPDHSVSLHARARLAHWTGHDGDFAAAAYLYHRLRDDQRRLLPPGHPDLATTETALAYWSQRRPKLWA